MDAEQMRRRHVQNYRAEVLGFCPWCAGLLLTSHLPNGWGVRLQPPCPFCGKMVFVMDREWDIVRVTSGDGRQFETDNTGWKRMFVQGQDRFYKRVGNAGEMVVLTYAEALAKNVVVGPVETGTPPSVTTVWTGGARKVSEHEKAEQRMLEARKQTPAEKPSPRLAVPTSLPDAGSLLSEAARGLMSGAGGKMGTAGRRAGEEREVLRALHVARFGRA